MLTNEASDRKTNCFISMRIIKRSLEKMYPCLRTPVRPRTHPDKQVFLRSTPDQCSHVHPDSRSLTGNSPVYTHRQSKDRRAELH